MIKSKTMSQGTNLSSSDKPMAKRPSITSQLASIAKVCPICGQSSHAGYTPFCSARCADVDLNRWNKGVYKL